MEIISPYIVLFKDLSQIFALIVGAGWVLWNYVLSRTHVPRLQPDIAAERLSVNGRHYIRLTASIKNPGQALVEIRARGTGIIVETAPTISSDSIEFSELEWESVVAFDIFENRPSIEPGIVFEEQQLIEVPSHETERSCRLTLRVVVPETSYKFRTYRKVIALAPNVITSERRTRRVRS